MEVAGSKKLSGKRIWYASGNDSARNAICETLQMVHGAETRQFGTPDDLVGAINACNTTSPDLLPDVILTDNRFPSSVAGGVGTVIPAIYEHKSRVVPLRHTILMLDEPLPRGTTLPTWVKPVLKPVPLNELVNMIANRCSDISRG